MTAVLTYTVFLPLIMLSMPKSGMAWHNRQIADSSVLGGINWYYTYALHPYNEDAQFVPMLWCDRYPAYDYVDGYDYLKEAQKLYPPDYRGWFLLLNEPDLPGSDRGGQCGMTPLQAAHFYKAAVELWPGARFVGPAVSHLDYLHGWRWLAEWYRLVAAMGLPMPATAAIHTYLNEPPNRIIDSLFGMLATYDSAPAAVWVTEFGACTPQQAEKMIYYFQNDGRVARYAWFTTRRGGCTDLFYDIPGYSLTPLGDVWRRAHDRLWIAESNNE